MSLESMTNHTGQNWSIECSDEESYFEHTVHYRTSLNRTRIWEPSGENIIRLYNEIETKGFNKLEWQCPGRISPSDLNQETGSNHYMESVDNSLTNCNQAINKSKFDFDNDFDEDEFNNSNTRVTKRTQATPKSQTDLSKVMLNIKKYQLVGNKNSITKQNVTTCVPSILTHEMTTSTSNSSNTQTKFANSSIESNINDFDAEMVDFQN